MSGEACVKAEYVESVEEKKAEQSAEAVRGTGVVCFAAAIIGDIWLLHPAFAGKIPGIPVLPLALEVLSWIVLTAGIIWLWSHRQGWGGQKGRILVFSLFGIYLFWSVWFYPVYQTIHRALLPESKAVAGAMVGVKLFVVMIGITAGIPTGPKIDGHEYAHRLREKAMKQEAQWAAESMKGARRDLRATVERLRTTLSPEELQALTQELQGLGIVDKAPEKSEKAGTNNTVGSEYAADLPIEAGSDISLNDLKNGWGGGI